MDYKHCCVVDAEGFFVVFVLALYRQFYDQPPLGEGGLPNWSKVETRMEWMPEGHQMAEGERLVDEERPPAIRSHAGVAGFICPRWDDTAGGWVEASTAEEIAAWEAEHPAPNPVPEAPNETELLRAKVEALETDKAERAELEAMAAAIERGLTL